MLGSPLFLCALIIAYSTWQDSPADLGPEPPRIQSVLGYIGQNCHKAAARKGRRRIANTAAKLVASIFERAGVAAPAGHLLDAAAPAHLDKMPRWISFLSHLNPCNAVSVLVDSVQIVPDSVFSAVEAEYNAGIVASKQPALARLRLEPCSLVSRILDLKCPVSLPVTISVAPCEPSDAPRGSFYYIGAGVGCGIREVQQVSDFPTDCTRIYVPVQFANTERGFCHLQEGFMCLGACEIDEYCQMVRCSPPLEYKNAVILCALNSITRVQVLAKHHPGLKVHPDMKNLDLVSQIPSGVLLDVVVISTPCVDVSARGSGLAQKGTVRT
jgi:hypothetical protein